MIGYEEATGNPIYKQVKTETPKARKYNINMLAKMAGQKQAGRYYWLNTQCLTEDRGIEVRLFPYITTPEGLKKVVEFTQRAFMDYFLMKKTQSDLKMLLDFYKNARLKRFRSSALSQMQELVRISLGIKHLRQFWNLTPRSNGKFPSGDIQLILASWYKENPKILIESKRDKEFVKYYKESGALDRQQTVNGFQDYTDFYNTLRENEQENEIELDFDEDFDENDDSDEPVGAIPS